MIELIFSKKFIFANVLRECKGNDCSLLFGSTSFRFLTNRGQTFVETLVQGDLNFESFEWWRLIIANEQCALRTT